MAEINMTVSRAAQTSERVGAGDPGEAAVGRVLLSLSPDISAAALLDCLTGVRYLVDASGKLLAFSPDRAGGMVQGNAGASDEALFVGRSLFEAIGSDEVREASRIVHQAVWTGQLTAFGFEYRCDDPDMKRSIWLSLSRIDDAAAPVAVLYQSLLLSETPRAPIRLFEPSVRVDPQAPATDAIVTLCSYCHAVAWPVGAEQPEWIEAVDYYRRGGSDDVAVSHGICPGCYQRVVGPSLRAANVARQAICNGG